MRGDDGTSADRQGYGVGSPPRAWGRLLEAYLLATVILLCALIFACCALLSLRSGDTYAAGWPTRSGQRLWELMERDTRRDGTRRDDTRLGGR